MNRWPAGWEYRVWVPQDGDTKCQTCLGINPTWWVQHEVWNTVMGSEEGILCPTCFILKADANGLSPRGAWQLFPPAELQERKLVRGMQ